MIAAAALSRWSPAPLPGLGAALLLGLAATVAGTRLPVVGAPVLAVAGGVLLSPLARRSEGLAPGLDLARVPLLQLSVVLLGARLSLGEVASVGVRSLPVMLGTLGVCLLLAWAAGRWLGVPRDLRTLIGVGTGVCGASAIAATAAAIRPRSEAVAYALSTIFVFNLVAVLVFPPLGHALGLSPHAFGLLAGTAVNDTSSVIAAAGAYGDEALRYAVVVKLVRTLMIIPIVAVLAGRRAVAAVPWFLIAFLALAGLHTAGLIPAAAQPVLQQAALLLTAVALAAVGLATDVAALRRTGARPLLLGLILWLAVTATSLTLQYVLP